MPIVGTPLFADQMANTDVIVGEGWGLRVDFETMTDESLLNGIKEVLENPKQEFEFQCLIMTFDEFLC